MIYDTFPVNDELDMIECRLTELENVPGVVHVAVEADVDHQGHPKPYHLSENLDRFAQWKERLVVVRATDLPSATDAPDPWARERAQREWCGIGLVNASNDDVVMHGDLDEIPTALVARNVRPHGMVAMEMVGHFWSCLWRYPFPWMGTVATTTRNLRSFCGMRDARNVASRIPNAGNHLSWLGGPELAMAKVESFCHDEVRADVVNGIASGRFVRDGWHVDGTKMARCDIDVSFPKWVRDGLCPPSWLL